MFLVRLINMRRRSLFCYWIVLLGAGFSSIVAAGSLTNPQITIVDDADTTLSGSADVALTGNLTATFNESADGASAANNVSNTSQSVSVNSNVSDSDLTSTLNVSTSGVDTSDLSSRITNNANQAILQKNIIAVQQNQQLMQNANDSNFASVVANQETIGTAMSANQKTIIDNQSALAANQADMASGIAANQSTTIDNQAKLKTHQRRLASRVWYNQQDLKGNQDTIYSKQESDKLELREQIQQMMNKDKLQGVLFGGGSDPDNQDTDNFLVRMIDHFNAESRSPQASADVSQATQAMLHFVESSTYQSSLQSDMQETIALVMSGAGNRLGKEDFSVSDVVPGAVDPYLSTANAYEAMIYPLMVDEGERDSGNANGKYVMASCRNQLSGVDEVACNLMIGAEYARLLTQSCKDDFKLAGSCENSGTGANALGGSATSSAGGVSVPFVDGYPSPDVCGCMSELLYNKTSTNDSWNGWRSTISALNQLMERCDAFDAAVTSLSSSTDPNVSKYQAMRDSAKETCGALRLLLGKDTVDSTYLTSIGKTGYIGDYFNDNHAVKTDLSETGKGLLVEAEPLLKAISESVRPLLFWQIFTEKSNSADDAVKNYGSLWGMIGADSYASANNGSLSTADLDDCTEVMSAYIAADDATKASNFTVSTGRYSESVSDFSKARLAELYMNQLLNNVRFQTIIDVPDINRGNCEALVAKNGRFYCFDSSGKALNASMTNSSGTYDVTLDVGVNEVKSNQINSLNRIDAFSKTYRNSMAPLNIQKLFTLSVLQKSYADRNTNITVSNGSKSCTFTPAQAMTNALTWRMDPNRSFTNADSKAVQAQAEYQAALSTAATAGTTAPDEPLEEASGTWSEHLASSNVPEVMKEIATLLQLNNYISGKLYKQQEMMSLLQTLTTVSDIETRRVQLNAAALNLKSLSKNYYRGAASSSGVPGASGE